MSMRKPLLIASLVIGIPLLLASVAIFWLCYTASGLQFALLQLNRVPHLSIKVDGVTGNIAGPLHVDHITLDHERIHIDIEQFDVDLTPALLLSGLVEVNRLEIGKVVATFKPPKRITPDAPIHFLPAFLRISVDELILHHAEYIHTSGYTIVATPLRGSADLSRSRLQVRNLDVVTTEFDARGELTLDSTSVLNLQATLDAAYKLVNGPVLRGDVKANGPITGKLRELKFDALTHQPHEAVVSGVLAFPDSGWSVVGDATSDKVLLDAWWQQPTFSLSKLNGHFALSAAGMHYQGEVIVPEYSTAKLRFDADTHYAQRVFTIDRADVAVPATGVKTRTQGTITLQTGSKPLLDMRGSWQQLRWPLHANDANAYFVSPQGNMKLRGTLPYQYEVQGDVRTALWPLSQVQADGVLRTTDITLAHFNASTLQGTATGSAMLQFALPRNWQFELNGMNLDPEVLQPAWPGSLTIKASAKGRGFDKQAAFDARVQSLSGVIRKQNVRASGRVQREGKRWQVDALDAQWGGAHLAAQGVVGPQNNLKFSVTAPQLQQLHPDLAGDLNMTGEVVGATDTPLLKLNAQSAHINYAGTQADTLKLEALLDLNDRIDSHLGLTATKLMHGTNGMEQMSLTGDGRMIGHELGLRGVIVNSMVPKGYGINIYTGAAYTNDQYHGVLYKLQLLDDKQAVRVDLQEPSNWLFAANHSQVQALCVKVDAGQGCADADWTRDARGITNWTAHANLKDLPLSIGNSALADKTRLQATVNGQLDLSALNGAPWLGTAGLQLSDASIRYRSGAGREEVLPITLGEMQMNATATDLFTSTDIRLSEQTVISLTANLDRRIGTGFDSWPLSGLLALSSSDARLIPVFVNEVDRASGTLATALQLSGTALSPNFVGSVQLLAGELDFYQTNLALRGLQFNAQVDTDQTQYTAQGNAGEGVLYANGSLSWRNSTLAGNLNIKGDRLLVADLPEYHVLASPDINFEINDKQVVVKGEVVIPEARLQPKEIVGAVQTSADARFKSDEVFDRQNGVWTISSDVRIRLGDDVNFDGLGLQGKLGGAVATRLRSGDTPAGSGELSVNGGSYEIYGQKLDIKRGRLLFDNTPLSDPGLDIQAERKINDTTVGVNVRGILRAPRLQFYSDPTMSQTQIVSYLLIGKPLDELQNGEATTVRSASNTLALQGGGYIAAQLGRRIGLEQVGVETDSRNQSALVLGKFLSPRLFISYGISLTEAINTVKLRYTLSDHWTIKTEAGEAKGADVEYKIER
jgi:translocation and assembly module TamB